MTIDWWTLGLQTINVLILIWILARFLFRPVTKIIADRQAAAHAALDEAQQVRDAARAARDEANAEAAEISRTRAALLEKAQDEATQAREKLLATVRIEAERARADTRAELEQMRGTAKTALAEDAAALAADIAARLMGRLPDTARVDGFVDGLAKAVADLPEATRTGIGTGDPVRLRAARALTDDEQLRLEALLIDALGHPINLEIETDAALIAGLELDAPHAIIRNHFRADLDRIIAEVTSHA
ncbi:F0F1 ATP synthase subunit B family protein [Tropicimonas marinistellae]|uniref:F0F1 ATP synthase subunit B family protein n=1 Tax=Tropicimonas marinistellae TaxID=1739787 RepID=UPI00083284CB|nr:ATP synthase F0 subunit B [Tropicimonas marinistellae]